MTATITILPLLISVAFFTLMERKLMAMCHFRLGPNKMGLMGLTQPFNDAAKLLTKEMSKLKNNSTIMFNYAPAMVLCLMMAVWSINPFNSNPDKMNLAMMMFITISSINIFFMIMSGWSSFSKYSIMGAYRSTAQTISYEITMLIILLPSIMLITFMTHKMNFEMNFMMSMNSALLLVNWIIIMLAETNRTPFDLSESESELVSGFNTEYSNGQFSMIFIAEYSMIIFMSSMTISLFLANNNKLIMSTEMLLMFTLFIWTRVSFPRMRYDMLMYTTWKVILPLMVSQIMLVMMTNIMN